MSQILVTGFQPFLGQKTNPSAVIAEKLAAEQPQHFKALILPVVYEKAFMTVKKYVTDQGQFPDRVILLGQAAGRKQICLERVALNWIESQHADEEQVLSTPREIIAEAPAAYIQKKWPLFKCIEDQAVKVSHSAGTYVCNELYFQMLHHYQSKQSQICFVHLPLIPEQVEPGSSDPSLNLGQQFQTIQNFIAEFSK